MTFGMKSRLRFYFFIFFILTFFFVSISSSLTCTTPQQNDDFLQLLHETNPQGIYTFSHFNGITGRVTDARNREHDRLLQYGQNEVRWPPIDATVTIVDIDNSINKWIRINENLWSFVQPSSVHVGFSPARMLMPQDYGGDSAHYALDRYSSGIYVGNDGVYDGYKGDWLKWTISNCFRISKLRFVPHQKMDIYSDRLPGHFILYAREYPDEGPFSVVHSQDQPAGGSTLTIDLHGVCYREYAIVVGSLNGITQSALNIDQMQIFGVYGPKPENDPTVGHFMSPTQIDYPIGDATINTDERYESIAVVPGDTIGTGLYRTRFSSRFGTGDSQHIQDGRSPKNLVRGGGDNGCRWRNDVFDAQGQWKGPANSYHGGTLSSINGEHNGEWFQIKLPQCFRLKTSRLQPQFPSKSRSPGIYSIFGRMHDSDPWTVVHNQTSITALVGEIEYSGETININIGVIACYFQYALVVKTLHGPSSILEISRWHMLGFWEPPRVVHTPADESNGVHPVSSVFAQSDKTWRLPSITSENSTECWIARSPKRYDNAWVVACCQNIEGTQRTFLDQLFDGDGCLSVTTANADNNVHSYYIWSEALTDDQTRLVTRGMRMEIGGKSWTDIGFNGAVGPRIKDIAAYHLRYLLAMRPPKSLHIFDHLTGEETRRVDNRVVGGAPVTVTDGVMISDVAYLHEESENLDPTTNNGVTKRHHALIGTAETQLLWAETSIPTLMTMCSVTRWTGTYHGDLLNSLTPPRYVGAFRTRGGSQGHIPGRRGAGWNGHYTTGQESATYGSGVTAQTDWVIMCTSTSVHQPGNVFVDQAAIGISDYNENIQGQLNVNYHAEGGWSEVNRSEFAIHSVYIWDTELNPEQMRQVTRALRMQLGGTPNFQDSPVALLDEFTVSVEPYCVTCENTYAMNMDTGVCGKCVPGSFFDEESKFCRYCSLFNGPDEEYEYVNPMTSLTGNTDSFIGCVCSAGFTSGFSGQNPTDNLKCEPCPFGQFKSVTGPGVCHDCPGVHTTTLQYGIMWRIDVYGATELRPVSTSIDACVCKPGFSIVEGECSVCGAGFYKLYSGNHDCTQCPDGSISPPGSQLLEHCTCMEGHTRIEELKEGLECRQCDADTYQDNLVAYTCTNCPSNTGSDMGATDIDECYCNAGYTNRNADGCEECAVDTYKSSLSNDQCTVCPDNTNSNIGSVSVSQCVCQHGYSTLQDGMPCIECEEGTYKDQTGSVECMMCPHLKSSLSRSVLESDCKCIEGYYEDNGDCISCPVGTTSLFNATSIEHCLCMAGWILYEEGCIPCPPGSYKTMIGNERQCTSC